MKYYCSCGLEFRTTKEFTAHINRLITKRGKGK